MQQQEAGYDVCTPGQNTYDGIGQGKIDHVLRQFLLAGTGKYRADLEHPVESLGQIAQATEHECQGDCGKDLCRRQVYHIVIQKVCFQIRHRYTWQVEHIGRHIETERDAPYRKEWDYRLPEYIIQPGYLYVWALDLRVDQEAVVDPVGPEPLGHISFIVNLQKVGRGRDGLDDGQLENPPDDDQNAQQHISRQGQYGGNHKDREGYVIVDIIRKLYLEKFPASLLWTLIKFYNSSLLPPCDYACLLRIVRIAGIFHLAANPPLPNGEKQQERR